MTKIKVRPTKPSAEKLKHPVDGAFRPDGDGFSAMWSYDTFTCRRLTDGSIERVPDPVPAPDAAPAKPDPAPAPFISNRAASTAGAAAQPPASAT